MNFPSHLPDGCPLPEATSCDSTVFMISTLLPVSANCCLSQAERGKALTAKGRAVCTRHGLSVFKDLQACLHHRKLYPYLGDSIVQATLGAQHGRLAETPSNSAPLHCTWWPFVAVARHSLFTEVANVV